jgi:hypothetical protein
MNVPATWTVGPSVHIEPLGMHRLTDIYRDTNHRDRRGRRRSHRAGTANRSRLSARRHRAARTARRGRGTPRPLPSRHGCDHDAALSARDDRTNHTGARAHPATAPAPLATPHPHRSRRRARAPRPVRPGHPHAHVTTGTGRLTGALDGTGEVTDGVGGRVPHRADSPVRQRQPLPAHPLGHRPDRLTDDGAAGGTKADQVRISLETGDHPDTSVTHRRTAEQPKDSSSPTVAEGRANGPLVTATWAQQPFHGGATRTIVNRTGATSGEETQ